VRPGDSKAEPSALWHCRVRLVETHISWVLLAPSLAYKLKKPLQFPFLDFSTLLAIPQAA
jgi:aminoglycoside phosphotransferase family enzyme